jgi:quinolinate synthetase A subunit
MAETAKILNPNKIVVLPDLDAGCSLEESCPAPKLKALQDTNPKFYTIAYINCSAEVKALSDVICTSGNAVKIVKAAPKDRDLLFVPDENLGAGSWSRPVAHDPLEGQLLRPRRVDPRRITRIRREHPDAPLVAHPECTRRPCACSPTKSVRPRRWSWCKQAIPRPGHHYRHRGRHAPPPEKGMPRQDLHPRSEPRTAAATSAGS